MIAFRFGTEARKFRGGTVGFTHVLRSSVPPRSGSALPACEWRPIALAVAASTAVLAATAGRYGYHRDELYFLQASRHLAWGYVHQPPLTPAMVRLETAVFGDSVQAIRIVPILCAAGMIVVAALTARELAGHDSRRSRRAQAMAAMCTAPTMLPLFAGHLFVTATPNIVFWAVLLLLLTRWLRTSDDRLWLSAGAVAGIGMLNNNLVGLLALALLLSLAIGRGSRRVFRLPFFWFGTLLAFAVWAPNLIWQAMHHWPQLTMARAISAADTRTDILAFQIEAALFLTPVWVAGWWSLARGRRAYRPLALGFCLVVVLVLATDGKPYYPAGYVPFLLGAGAVTLVDWLDRARTRIARRRRRAVLGTGVVLTAAATLALGPPVLPLSAYTAIAGINKENGESVGWPELADTVAQVYRTLPPAQRSQASIITENYGEAGALAHYGPALDLPPAYAPHDGYALFGLPTSTGITIAVGYQPSTLAPYWSHCAVDAHIRNHAHIANLESDRPVLVCIGQLTPWPAVWHRLMHYS